MARISLRVPGENKWNWKVFISTERALFVRVFSFSGKLLLKSSDMPVNCIEFFFYSVFSFFSSFWLVLSRFFAPDCVWNNAFDPETKNII